MRTNALMVAFMSASPWLGTPESNNVSTEKCNLRCFCIYLYVQIQRIRCKNIYVNIYIHNQCNQLSFYPGKHMNT